MDAAGSQSPNVEEGLKVILAEYNALRAEILQRSQAQSRIAEFHVTVLTGIIGTAILQSDISPWLILLIPIESSLFGTWYIDHAIFIARLGRYIHDSIEQTVKKLFGGPVLAWESSLKEGALPAPAWRASLVAQLAFLPFAAPSLLALVLSTLVLFSDSFRSLLKVSPGFSQGGLHWVFLLGWLISIGFFLIYISWVIRWYSPRQRRQPPPAGQSPSSKGNP